MKICSKRVFLLGDKAYVKGEVSKGLQSNVVSKMSTVQNVKRFQVDDSGLWNRSEPIRNALFSSLLRSVLCCFQPEPSEIHTRSWKQTSGRISPNLKTIKTNPFSTLKKSKICIGSRETTPAQYWHRILQVKKPQELLGIIWNISRFQRKLI